MPLGDNLPSLTMTVGLFGAAFSMPLLMKEDSCIVLQELLSVSNYEGKNGQHTNLYRQILFQPNHMLNGIDPLQINGISCNARHSYLGEDLLFIWHVYNCTSSL
uniref:Uncharacterized protein n=1 Tax=Micrurus corallinus TaxID=54390 RepID=A0A2D4GKB2_MICCO